MYYKIIILLYINLWTLLIKSSLTLPIISIFFLIFLIIIPLNNKFINPLSINLIIIFITISISIFLNIINKTNWFSILIFLIIIGGIIILFLYLNRFAINEFSFLNNLFLKNFKNKLIFLLFLINIIQELHIFNYIFININNLNSKIKIFFINEPTTLIIFRKTINYLLIFIITYLLITLIVITFICIRKKSSIRILN